ncbi:CHASE3 domain-containing protein [Alloacidobacterium dinghuense]|uniref:histidine kinase n=1 Tax=Alloacidobacterium dinghuense TaxID=2763107 RepID=A0A7G8BNQ7_9BACT|nr:ATP-binding protein [Alloacidobacterium dinghuense]QNI34177.1 CHASE3 domain-containing protein [Alloacidobacterium dinghuense]
MNFRDFQRVLKQAFYVPLLALAALAGVLLWQATTTEHAQIWLDHSDLVSAQVAELERRIIDQQTVLRGYELTEDRAMLQAFDLRNSHIDAQFTSLRQLISDNPQQIGNLVGIHDAYLVWLSFAQTVIASPAPAADKGLAYRGRDLMSAVRQATRTMSEAEDRLRKQRLEKTILLERREVTIVIVGAFVVGLALSIFSMTRLKKVSRAYQDSLDSLQKRSTELYESREWLHTTLRSIGDAVIACGADSGVEFMNSVAEELTGWQMGEARGKPLQQVFHIVNEFTREEAESPVEKVRRQNAVIGLANHTALISRDGSEYVIDDSAAPIRDKDGTMIGIVLVFRDVTDQKRTEAALIANEKLAVAGRLAASIAHEIHNPLDSVANLHYLLERENDPAKRSEYLEMAQQELKRTMQISRTMLNLYREPNAPIVVDLKELLEGVLLLLQRRLDNQGITVQRDFDSGFAVEGFPAELRQVFANLIANAVDAAGSKGRILIRMRGAPAEELRGAGVVIEILDSGPGISNQASQKIFQPFFTTKGDQGTGLGLWVSMGIVQKHGGTIRVENTIDGDMRGATVRVYLPARTLATPSSRSTLHIS